ncbi:MAG: ATP-binding protein, partial [Niameybacter sp.]
QIVFEERKESNPCSLCSKMRKGALNDIAKELGCNKIALGHNKDDINETLLMSLFYEGRIHTMSPVTYLDRSEVSIIRPLIYVPERDIKYFAKKEGLPVVKSPCPADGVTRRETTKQMIYALEKEIPQLSNRLFGAIERSEIDGWKSRE